VAIDSYPIFNPRILNSLFLNMLTGISTQSVGMNRGCAFLLKSSYNSLNVLIKMFGSQDQSCNYSFLFCKNVSHDVPD
jgi:hypothetical protein